MVDSAAWNSLDAVFKDKDKAFAFLHPTASQYSAFNSMLPVWQSRKRLVIARSSMDIEEAGSGVVSRAPTPYLARPYCAWLVTY